MTLYGAALEHVLYPSWERLRRRPTFPLLRKLQRTERASADELEAMRAGFLRRLVRHAYENTAHYRDALHACSVTPDDIRCVADVAKLPVLDRAAARASVESRTARWPAVAVTKATNGYGVPTSFGRSASVVALAGLP